MKKYKNARKPWPQKDMLILLNHAPTWANCNKLAPRLGRSPAALKSILWQAGRTQKELRRLGCLDRPVIQQMVRARRALGRIV